METFSLLFYFLHTWMEIPRLMSNENLKEEMMTTVLYPYWFPNVGGDIRLFDTKISVKFPWKIVFESEKIN